MILLIGAKPVPLATKIMGLSVSSRRKKVPRGPSNLRISFSLSVSKTCVVKAPFAMFRTCSSIYSASWGGLPIE